MTAVRGDTPWTRAVVADFLTRFPDTFRAIQAAMPPGHHILVAAHQGVYGRWIAILRDGSGEVVRSGAQTTVTGACYEALEAGRKLAAA